MEIPSSLGPLCAWKGLQGFCFGEHGLVSCLCLPLLKSPHVKLRFMMVQSDPTECRVTGILEPSCCLMWHLGAGLDSALHWDTPTGYRSKRRKLQHPVFRKCKSVCLLTDLLGHPWRPQRACCAVCWAPSPQRLLLEGTHFTCCSSLLSLFIMLL